MHTMESVFRNTFSIYFHSRNKASHKTINKKETGKLDYIVIKAHVITKSNKRRIQSYLLSKLVIGKN